MDEDDRLLAALTAGSATASDAEDEPEAADAVLASVPPADSVPKGVDGKPKRKRGRGDGRPLPARTTLALPASMLETLEFDSVLREKGPPELLSGKRKRDTARAGEAASGSPAAAQASSKHARFSEDEWVTRDRLSDAAAAATGGAIASTAPEDAAQTGADAAAAAALRLKQKHFFGGRLARSGAKLAVGGKARKR
jgi:hypothetical protein